MFLLTTAAGRFWQNLRHRRFRLQCYAVIAVLGGGVGWWECSLKDRFAPKRFGVVVPETIFRSGQNSRWVIEDVLVDHEIKTIVDLNGLDPADEHQRAEIVAAERLGIPLVRLPMSGNGTGDIRRYAQALAIMHNARQTGDAVLVHCHAGAKRTGTAVAFYRLLVQRWSPDVVLEEMRQYDGEPGNSPELIAYINSRMPTLAELLVQRGVLRHVPEQIPQLNPSR